MKKLFDIDFIGMAASVLCLIHCLALPWLIALAGTFLGSYVESPHFHTFMLVLAVAIGLPVFVISFMKYKSKLILFTGVAGLALTTFGTMQEDTCCPAPTVAQLEECESSACETECDNTITAKVEACDSTCETECESTIAAKVNNTLIVEAEKCDSACETECESSSAISETEVAKTIDIEEPALLQGFNTVPLGVTLLLLAHFLNFRKKRSCKRDCCQ